MLESKSKLLVTSVKKLYRRGAWRNIRRIIHKTHAPDIGLLLEELDRAEAASIFQMIDTTETKAEVLSYVDSKIQRELLEKLDAAESKKLVSLMDSDDAADLLGGLPKDLSEQILSSMHKEDSEEVADLMRYPEDSAGGLMSTDYLAMDQSLTVEDAIKEIQEQEEESLISFYIYVVDEDENLVGVLSLKALILSKPNDRLRDIMTRELITVGLETDQEEVARIVEHYDFLSLPVVNDDMALEGIITVDDVIDVIREESAEDLKAFARVGGEDESFLGQFRGRFPWVLFSYFGGICAFILVSSLGKKWIDSSFLNLAAFVPLLLALGNVISGQVSVAHLTQHEDTNFDSEFFKAFLKDLGLAGIFTLLFCLVNYWIFNNVFEAGKIAISVSLILGVQILFASTLGSFVPTILKKMKLDPAIASGPLITVIVDLVGLLLLFQWGM